MCATTIAEKNMWPKSSTCKMAVRMKAGLGANQYKGNNKKITAEMAA